MPLTDSMARNAKPAAKAVRMFDRDGLYLEVSPRGGKWWRLPFALPVTNHTLFINSCLSSCTYCLVSDRRSAALNWEGVVPSHVRKAR